MSYETLTQPSAELDFTEIHKKLIPQLYTHVNPLTKNVSGVLEKEIEPFDHEECAEIVYQELTKEAAQQALQSKGAAFSYATHEYPKLLETKAYSHKKYAKENNLDGTKRVALRDAKEATITSAKISLQNTVKSIEISDISTIEIDKEAFANAAIELRNSLVEEIDTGINQLRQLMPVDKRMRRMLDRIMSNIAVHPGAHVLYPAKIPVDDPEKIDEIENTLNSLYANLSDYRRGNGYIVAELLDGLKPQVKKTVVNNSNNLLMRAVRTGANKFPSLLLNAYSQVASREIPKPTNGIDVSTVSKNGNKSSIDNSERRDETKAANTSYQPGEIVITNPEFSIPWNNHGPITLKVLNNGQNNTVVCSAMPHSFKKISADLRFEERDQAEFDRMWEQVQKIELSNPNGINPYRKMVNDIENIDFKNLLVLSYGNASPNAKRIYYVKTTIDRFIDKDTISKLPPINCKDNFIILVAETDKAHQLDIYKGFGISRSKAKNWRVGSI